VLLCVSKSIGGEGEEGSEEIKEGMECGGEERRKNGGRIKVNGGEEEGRGEKLGRWRERLRGKRKGRNEKSNWVIRGGKRIGVNKRYDGGK